MDVQSVVSMIGRLLHWLWSCRFDLGVVEFIVGWCVCGLGAGLARRLVSWLEEGDEEQDERRGQQEAQEQEWAEKEDDEK